MNKQRTSRNAEKRVARLEVETRGRASLSRRSQLDREGPLTSRRLRRANGLTRALAAQLELFARRPDGSLIIPELITFEECERICDEARHRYSGSKMS